MTPTDLDALEKRLRDKAEWQLDPEARECADAITQFRLEVADVKKVRDEWCAEYTKARDERDALAARVKRLEEALDLKMADGTPFLEYLRDPVPEDWPMDDWTKGSEHHKRVLLRVLGPQLKAIAALKETTP